MDQPTPIAVVGIGCRFPGGADSPEKFWKILAEGRDTWSSVPEERFNWKSFHHPNNEAPGAVNHLGGHFVEGDISRFDGKFFGLPPQECEAIDPQFRFQLEVTYEALENAGLRLEDLRGSDTAVYVATFGQDYAHMQDRDLETISKYYMTGTGLAMASNRISYLLDLRGPSVTLDTGCSGSMVAIHQACQSLRTGESKIAVAGGVSLIITPDMMVPMSMIGVLNPNGKSYSFDRRGAGYGRGEGAAMVVLKRLDDAILDGDNIRGIIRNSGVNQDGKTPGITVPSRDAQLQLIRQVYSQANLSPLDTKYAEAHGTGTVAGDDAEVWALRQAFTGDEYLDSNDSSPLRIGSVKPNIGHLESASGAASLIKAILMLENDAMPPVINLKGLKDSCQGEEILIPTIFEPWDKNTLRRISVNNFGYGGTNGHLILDSLSTYNEESRARKPRDEGPTLSNNYQSANGLSDINNNFHQLGEVTKYPQVLTFSAKSKDSLINYLENIEQWLTKNSLPCNDAIQNLAHTLSTRRSVFRWRYSLVGTSLSDVASRLRVIRPSIVKAVKKSQNVFLFTGQGAQWHAMGRELMRIDSAYSKSLQASEAILRQIGASWSLIEELSYQESTESRINESQIAQPATTAIQIALIDLLSSLNVKPDVVLGHSSGEIAAAYAAGSLSQSSALKAAYYRGRLQVSPSLKGAMMAAALGEEPLAQYISRIRCGKLVVACCNSPESSTVSGDETAIHELKDILSEDSVFTRVLAVDTAYHSHHLVSASEVYLQDLKGLEYESTSPNVLFISSVTGEEKVTGFGAEYWVQNLVSQVRFQTGLEQICRKVSSLSPQTKLSFIEIGPHNALSGPLRQTMSSLSFAAGYSSASILLRKQDACYTLLETAGKLFEQGSSIHIEKLNLLFQPSEPRKALLNLPTYAWDHSDVHWHESRLSRAHRFRKNAHHDLLGSRIASSTTQNPIWRHMLGVDQLPWLREHVIDGFMIFPASGYVSMAVEALLQSSHERYGSLEISSYNFKNIKFEAPLLIPESPKTVEIQLALTNAENMQDSWNEFKIFSVSAQGSSVELCHGHIIAYMSAKSDDVEASREREADVLTEATRLSQFESVCKEELDRTQFYEDMEKAGNKYTGNFACMERIRLGGTKALSSAIIPDTSQCMPSHFQQPHVIHPSTLDAMMHHPLAIISRYTTEGSLMVVGVESLKVSSRIANESGTLLNIATSTLGCGSRFPSADISVFQQKLDSSEGPVIQIKNLRFRSTAYSTENVIEDERNISYNMEWDLDADHMTSSMFSLGPDFLAAERAQEDKLYVLNQAAAIYVRRCVRNLTVCGPPNLPGHFPHLFDWMQRFNQSENSKYLLQGVSEVDESSILESAQKLGVEGELSQRLGPNMEAILTGKLDAISLMTEDNLLWRIYSDNSSALIYGHVIKYMKQLAFKSPNIRVLELGGGTAATTIPLLEALGPEGILPFDKYVFTDVSTGFFERTKERLKKWDTYMEYQKLDMNNGFVEQGFEEGTYDLILGANCIHIASSVGGVMSNIRKLLKPGGRIVMVEIIRVVPFYTTFMGVFDGWWAGVHDGRVDAPTLTVDQWHTTLLQHGFNGAEIIATDYEGTAQRSAMIVSKATNKSHDSLESSNGRIELIISPNWPNHRPKLVSVLQSKFQHQGFDMSIGRFPCTHFQGDTTYIILDNGESPVLTMDEPSIFNSIRSLLSNATRVLWISTQHNASARMNPEKGMIAGLARVCRAENPSLQLITINVQDTLNDEDLEHLTLTINKVFEDELIDTSNPQMKELEYIYMNKEVSIPRLIPNGRLNERVQQAAGKSALQLQPFYQPGRPLKIRINKPGLLDSLSFDDESSFVDPLPASYIEVRVEACGVNYKDVMIALGHVDEDLPMAGEFSGVITDVGTQQRELFTIGDRVCGFGASSYTSIIRLDGRRAARIPLSMSFEVAASIPVVFATAYHSLIEIANLQRGQTVLIQSATGGVGQAALRIAQNIGAEVFVTVGSAAKRQLLIEKFNIPEDHIFSSKLLTFREGIRRLTHGNGVDVVINSFSGEALRDSWDCIARFGVFIELGKADSLARLGLNTKPFARNVTFSSVNLQLICDYKPEKAASLLKRVVQLFEEDILAPIEPITTMPITNIVEAFRLVQAREHKGKIILKTNSETLVMAPTATSDTLIVSRDGTYVIAGGLGDLGLEIAHMLANHGAKYIVLLSRRHVQPGELVDLETRFQDSGAKVVVLNCDITNLQSVNRVVSTLAAKAMLPIKGVVQATNVLHDRVLSKMELQDFKISTGPKRIGTANLLTALVDQPLEFFLMLSSISSVVGTIAQGSYAAANNYMDTIAYNNKVSGASCTHFAAIDFGPIDDAGVIVDSQRTKDGLIRQGYILIKLKELLALVRYAISHTAKDEKSNQFVLGIDYKSILDSDNKYTLRNPMFAHLSRRSKGGLEVEASESKNQSFEELVSGTDDSNKITDLISEAITIKISKLVAIDSEEIDVERNMGDFGIDSLVSIEMKNWITQTFKAKLQASEISEADNILALAALVASRSAIISQKHEAATEKKNEKEQPNRIQNGNVNGIHAEHHSPKDEKEVAALPKQPLPELDQSLYQFLDRLLPILTPKEYMKYESYVEGFRKQGGFGRKLQARLSKLSHDPRVENWLGEFYTTNMFLKSRRTLVPWSNFFATHLVSPFQHTVAERAAIISVAAFQFKQDLEQGKVAQQFFNDQATCSSAYKWFFNATREPGEHVDAMRKYPGNDYLVAFRRGHAYRIPLSHGNEPVSFAALRETFQHIIDTNGKAESWVGLLTQDGRDSWAHNRTELQDISESNRTWIHDIEASAFIIYLDEARPQNASERGPHFLHANGRNRWSDKTIQFSVCDNGISASIGDHTTLDGVPFMRLNNWISDAIVKTDPKDFKDDAGRTLSAAEFSEYTFETTLQLEEHIEKIRTQMTSDTSRFEYRIFEIPSINRTVFREHKCPPNSGGQLTLQLAARRYWGHNPLTVEPISHAHFSHGRIDVNFPLLPSVATFCTAATEPQPPTKELRRLFFDAARAHASSVTTVARGHGFDRHFLALKWVVRDEEEVPALFTDEVYRGKRSPPRFMTNCMATGGAEGGDVFNHEDGLSVNFEVGDGCMKVSVWGNVGEVDRFKGVLEESARDVRGIVES